MATKSKINGLNGMHTAGIFSDMTVDGPEIGTLVVIVDRAKNLPNRKTIGKQDPYCAARLGKEAKKTETDRRGGQTPRWDQELRYTVHDSPDYYQLKVSVFNDDKKTDLIGETWVDLKDIIVPGGGQNDIWHSLNCKGKYAGEIRIEITYYDTRPKQEKPEKKREPTSSNAEGAGRDSLRGPRQPKSTVKRRPLPSDPVTGAPALAPAPVPVAAPVPIPAPIPDHAQMPPIGYHAPTAESVYSDSPDYREPPAVLDQMVAPQRGYQNPPNPVPDHAQSLNKNYQSPQVMQAEHVPTPARGYQNQPTQAPEQFQTPPRKHQNQSNQVPDYAQPPSRGYQGTQSQIPDQVQTQARGNQNQQSAIPDHVRTPSQNYHSPPASHQEQFQTPSRGYQTQAPPDQAPSRGYHQTSPNPVPEHIHTPQRQYENIAYLQNQSPLQMVEYNAAPSNYQPEEDYHNEQAMTRYGASSEYVAPGPPPQAIPDNRFQFYDQGNRNAQNERYDQYDRNDHYERHDQYERNDYTHSNESDNYGDAVVRYDPYARYKQQQIAYDPQPDDYDSPPSPGGPPPPPPAHRSRKGSSNVQPVPAMVPYGSYGFPSDSQPPPHNSIQQQEHRQPIPIPSHSPSNSYQAYSPKKEHGQSRNSPHEHHQENLPRRPSYDSRYHADYRSMQPTVEDEVPSPSMGPYAGHRLSSSRNSYEDPRYDNVPSPAPLNLGSRRSSASGRNSMSAAPKHQYSNSSIGHTSGSQNSHRDRSQTEAAMSSHTSYNQMSQQDQRPRRASENPMDASAGYGAQPLPVTLVPGMDPAIAQEIADKIYQEKRASNGGNSARGRYQNIPQHQPSRAHRLSYVEPAQTMPQQSSSYDERQSRYSMAMVPLGKPRPISPDPPRRLMRKSVSPSPAAADERRRLSGIPFGPDSYNALNPTLQGSVSTPSLSAAYDTKEIDQDAKIITHDGREIDPSDHIPEHNYAPLRELKGPKPPPPQPEQSANNGRRQLQHRSARPQPTQSMALTRPSYMSDPAAPQQRNRLQKKSARLAQEAAQQGLPLAPITSYQDNSFTPRSLPRANTGDFSTSENYSPGYSNGSQHYRGSSSSGPPPIPAKVPMMLGAPPGTSQSMNSSSTGDAWALLEEMKHIDLGSGRARRRKQ